MTTVQNTRIHPAGDRLESQRQDRFGSRVAARLSAGSAHLPHDVSERLRVARLQAVEQRKRTLAVTASAVNTAGDTATISFTDESVSFWGRLASVLPLVALIAGLIAISVFQTEQRAADTAEVDAAMLTDSLPASAYADPGFVQYLKIKTRGTYESGPNDQRLNDSGAYTDI
jgi:hypothetical protein